MPALPDADQYLTWLYRGTEDEIKARHKDMDDHMGTRTRKTPPTVPYARGFLFRAWETSFIAYCQDWHLREVLQGEIGLHAGNNGINHARTAIYAEANKQIYNIILRCLTSENGGISQAAGSPRNDVT
jgi:hypothetical protein